MFNFIRNMFDRRSNRFGLFGNRRSALTPKRGGIALGTLASIAAPFIIRKVMARRTAARS